MSLIIGKIYEYYNDFLQKSDKRTENYFLAGSPLAMLTVVTLYYLFVRKWGPTMMKHRKPYNIDIIIQVYNLFQVAANGYLIMQAITYIINNGFNNRCEEIDWTSPAGLVQANLVYMYYIIKVTDLLDTIFIIMRKKTKQASFLHIYHHAIMVICTYIIVKRAPGGNMLVIGIVNTFVHIIMYFYYFLTSFKTELKQSIWWKKHITQLQMAQFGYLMLKFLYSIIYNNCNINIIYLYLVFLQTTLIFLLFCNFYCRTYF